MAYYVCYLSTHHKKFEKEAKWIVLELNSTLSMFQSGLGVLVFLGLRLWLHILAECWGAMIIISNVRLSDGGTLSYSPALCSMLRLETSPYSWNISTNDSNMQLTNQIEQFNKGKWMPPKAGALNSGHDTSVGWVRARLLRLSLMDWGDGIESSPGSVVMFGWGKQAEEAGLMPVLKNTSKVVLLLPPWASAQAVFSKSQWLGYFTGFALTSTVSHQN